jgi:hypothetical protein
LQLPAALSKTYDRLVSPSSSENIKGKKCEENAERDLAGLLGLPDFRDVVSVLRNDKDYRYALAELLIPKGCEQGAVSIPPIKPRHIFSDQPLTKGLVHRQLNENSEKNIPTIWNYCEKVGAGGGCLQGHSTLIIGSREVCCAQECTFSYLIRDTLPSHENNPGHDHWQSEDYLMNRTFLKVDTSNYDGTNNGRTFYYGFQWVE